MMSVTATLKDGTLNILGCHPLSQYAICLPANLPMGRGLDLIMNVSMQEHRVLND